jgi:hypothetical protein
MATANNPELIIYVDSSKAAWQEFRPGSQWKILHEDTTTGQKTMLVQWGPGYRMGALEHHEYDDICTSSPARLWITTARPGRGRTS